MFQKFLGQNTLRIRQKFTTWAMKLMPKYFLLTQMIRKISLGVKQLQPDPWDEIEEKYVIGTVHKVIVQISPNLELSRN